MPYWQPRDVVWMPQDGTNHRGLQRLKEGVDIGNDVSMLEVGSLENISSSSQFLHLICYYPTELAFGDQVIRLEFLWLYINSFSGKRTPPPVPPGLGFRILRGRVMCVLRSRLLAPLCGWHFPSYCYVTNDEW